VLFFGIPKGSLSIVNKLLNNTELVTEFYDCWYGKGGKTPKINLKGQGVRVLKGKEVQRYYIRDSEQIWYLSWDELNEKDVERSNAEKVVVQDIVAHLKNPNPHIKLTGALETNNSFCFNTVMCFSTKSEMSNEFLLGIINSKIMSFFYYYFIFNQAIRTMHFMPGYSDKIPLVYNEAINEKVTSIVSEILKAKKQDPEADTQQLEVKIDHLVYKLYELTYDEVLIVDPETSISREEYGG
jgi:hypothetical protein